MQRAGVALEPMLRSDWRQPRPGAYAVSAHALVRGLEPGALAADGSDWLRRHEPVETLDGSMYLYVFPAAPTSP